MMKKGIYAILAVLAVFAMVMTGCPEPTKSGSGPTYWTVSFVSGEGGLAVEPIKVKDGETIGQNKPADPSNSDPDMTFKGWYSDEALTQQYNFYSKVTKDIVLYAKWSKNVNLSTVKVGATALTNLGAPADTLAAVGRGIYETTDEQGAGVVITVTAVSENATVKWVKKATDPTEAEFDSASNPTTAVKFAGGERLYIRVTNGDDKQYYRIDLYFAIVEDVNYGQPTLVGSNTTAVDAMWEAQYTGPVFDISRINNAEVSTNPYRFTHTVAPGKNHTEGTAKAYWDDEGLYIYATISFNDYYEDEAAKAAGISTPRVTNMIGNYQADSFEIMLTTRTQLQPGNYDTAVQYRVGFNNGEVVSASDTYTNTYGTFSIGGNFRNNPLDPQLNPRHLFGQTLQYNAWKTMTGTKETGYKILAKVPWVLIGFNDTDQVFDKTSGKVKDNAKIGLDLQINASLPKDDNTGSTGQSRDAILTMSSVGKVALEGTANYAKITLAPPAAGAARPVETHYPTIDGNSPPSLGTDGQTMKIPAYVAPAVPTPNLSYQWWSAANATDAGSAIPSATSATYKPDDPAAEETAKTNYWVVVTNKNSAADAGKQAASVTSRRFEYKTEIPTATSITVKVGSADQADIEVKPGVGGTIAYSAVPSGYTYDYGTQNYGNGIVRFKVDLGTKPLGDFEKVTFTWTGVTGDAASNKKLYLLASATEAAITPWKDDGPIKALIVSTPPTGGFHEGTAIQVNGTSAQNVELSIVTTDATALALTGNVWFAIYMHADKGSYKITNVQFVEK